MAPPKLCELSSQTRAPPAIVLCPPQGAALRLPLRAAAASPPSSVSHATRRAAICSDRSIAAPIDIAIQPRRSATIDPRTAAARRVARDMLASMRGVSLSLVLLLTLRACHSRTRRVTIVFDPPYLCNNATGFGVGCRGSAATATHRVPTMEGDGAACTVTSVLGCYDLPGLSFVALLHDRNKSFDQNACAELCCHDGHTGGVFAVGIHAKTHGTPWSSVGGNCYCAANFAPPAKTLRPI